MAILEKQFEGIEPTLTGMSKFAYISQQHSIDAQVVGYETKTGIKITPTQGGSVGGTQGGSVQEKGKVKGKVEQAKAKVSFPDCDIFKGIDFKNRFPEWSKDKLRYYYDSAKSYSEEGNKYVNWGSAINNWAKRDELQGKLKFDKPVSDRATGHEGLL